MIRPVGAVLCLALIAGPAPGTVEHTARDETEEQRREAWRDAVSLARDGSLRLGPSTVRLVPRTGPGDGARPVIWSAAPAGTPGGLLVATGHQGELLRVGPGETSTVVFSAGEPEITAVLPGENGDLYVATAPQGALYRVLGDGRAELFALVEARYIWDLAWDGAGRVLAATGGPAAIVRIDGEGHADVLFQPERESHITGLLPTGGGVVLAASDGLGRLYSVDGAGEATVVYDAPYREIAAFARHEDGTLWVAAAAQRLSEKQLPRVRVRVPRTTAEGRLVEGAPDEEPDDGAALWGEIEGLDGGDGDGDTPRGAVVRIAPGGTPEEVWSPTEETPTALDLDGAGHVVVGTSEPARLYRLGPGDERSLLLDLGEGAVTHVGPDGAGGLAATTAHPGVVYRILSVTAERGTFHSRPLDGGAGARWGTLRWDGSIPAGGAVEIAARTGDSLPAGIGWSGWVPVSATPGMAPLTTPAGRYLQVRARLRRGAVGSSPVLRGLSARYRPANRAPGLTAARLAAPADGTGWSAHWQVEDPDEDPLWIRIEIAGAPGGPWEVVGEGRLVSPHPLPADRIGEGIRLLRITASDAPSNLPGEGRSATITTSPRLVHPEPPALDGVEVTRTADDGRRVTARADAGPEGLEGAWVSADGGETWWPAGAEDGVLDGPRDTVLALLPAGAGDAIVVRVRDLSGAERRVAAP